MLNFCPLCVAEVYAQRCDAMRAGTSRCPLHRPSTTYYLYCIRCAVFLYFKTYTYQLQQGVSKWVLNLWNQPFCIVLVYISVYRYSRRCAPQDDKSVISSDRRESRDLNHTNIPDPVHENALFCGRKPHFDGLIHENRHFHGQTSIFASLSTKTANFMDRE